MVGFCGATPEEVIREQGIYSCDGDRSGEGCHTATEGEECYTNVEWVMNKGVNRHPEWYPGLTESSSFDDVQLYLSATPSEHCPTPCFLNIVVETTTTFASTTTTTTIATTHPITAISTNTATLTTTTTVIIACHTAVPGDICYANVKDVMHQGLRLHPDWYDGLSRWSSFQEVQHHLSEQGGYDCPIPCPVACHIATKGEECYASVEWAMATGIHEHPGWFPGLTTSSSFTEFQVFYHREGHSDCPRPCSAM